MKSKIWIWCICMVILINLPLWSFITTENYCYSNSDKTYFVCEENGKGITFTNCVKHYGYFLAKHPEKDQGDNNLYRTFKIQPWKIWQWREYIFHSDRFQLPYLDTANKEHPSTP